jgi:hypothetical protein
VGLSRTAENYRFVVHPSKHGTSGAARQVDYSLAMTRACLSRPLERRARHENAPFGTCARRFGPPYIPCRLARKPRTGVYPAPQPLPAGKSLPADFHITSLFVARRPLFGAGSFFARALFAAESSLHCNLKHHALPLGGFSLYRSSRRRESSVIAVPARSPCSGAAIFLMELARRFRGPAMIDIP